MTIYKLDLPPNQDSYSVQRGTNFAEIQTGAGNTRIRRTSKNAEHRLNLTWTVDRNGYDLLQAFYRLWESQEPKIEYFLLDLILDSSELQAYKCYFVAGGAPNLTGVHGNAFTVSAQVRARAKPSNKEVDEVVSIGVLDLVNPLEILVNKKLADATENLK